MSVPEPQLKTPPAAAANRRDGPGVLHAVTTPTAGADASLLAAWLGLVCQMVPGVRAAFVGLDPADGEDFRSHAAWPDAAELDTAIRDAARYALQRETGIASETTDETSEVIARRLTLAAGRDGAVALEVPKMPDGARDTLMQLLDWGEAWLGLVMNAPVAIAEQPRKGAYDVMNIGLGEATLRTAATTMAALIANTIGADRVSIGLCHGDRIELIALSHTASFDKRLQFNKDIVAAMEEALDEGRTILFPVAAAQPPCATRAHERLCNADASAAVCTIVLRDGEQTIGALTLERRRGDAFDDVEQSELETLAPAIGRVLHIKQIIERPAHARLREALADLGRKLMGPGRLAAKFLALLAVIGVGILFFVDGDLHVAAPATLEGRVHRTLTAPIDGYIAEAPARAGDALKAGDVLAVVDTRGLEFERRRWANERSEFEKAHRRAVAKLDRAEATIMKARLGKAASQLALIEEQLARATVKAPFDGMVVSGDLSRSMGAPVSRGDVLFEMAPLDDYRVELEVDERDIADVQLGQRGYIALTALPGERLAFTVDKMTGVAEASDGRNVFKVEAQLEDGAPLLRPGMRGVGKITAGERRLFWVWTHQLVDRVQLWFWSRAP